MIKVFNRVLNKLLALLSTNIRPFSMHPLLDFMCPLISDKPEIGIRHELFG